MTTDCPKEIIEGIISHIESKFQVGTPRNARDSITGERYISFGSGGIHDDKEVPPALVSTWEKAAELFLYEFDNYFAGKMGKVFWRKYPEPRIVGHPGGKKYKFFYARFLISDKPELSEQELKSHLDSLYIARTIPKIVVDGVESEASKRNIEQYLASKSVNPELR